MAAELKQVARNPTQAPDYALHRVVKEAVEVGPFNIEAHGVNMANDAEALIQVIPTGGSNPTIDVLFWSPGANGGNGGFINEHAAIQFAGVGVNVPYEARVQCRGRKMLVAVTAGVGVGHTARVYVAGFNENFGR